MDTRDTKVYRHKGKETTTVKAKTGLVEYTRTKYITKDEHGINKCIYLTDQELWQSRKRLVEGKIKTLDAKLAFPLSITLIALILIAAAPALLEIS